MKLAAIYSVWADAIEFLPDSINCLFGHVDELIIVKQDISNFGEKADYELFSKLDSLFLTVPFTPNLSLSPMINETAKRNLGMEAAKKQNCTHFFHIDCDELWEDFGKAKQQFIDSGASSSVAQMWTYFQKPTLRFKNPDNYYVPFISELHKDTRTGNHKYPFYCDPTRKPSGFTHAVCIKELMHHFSWVRSDINMKIRNSSAKKNIEKSTLLRDYLNQSLTEGSYIEGFNQSLTITPNIFNL